MRISLFSVLVLVVLLCAGAIPSAFAPFSSSAHAARDHYTVPLVVVRFNQPRMYYEKPLFNAIASALNTKQDAYFNVIHYFPDRSDRLRAKAKSNFQQLLKRLNEMGVPRARIGIKEEAANDLNFAEVHIYVR